MFGERRSNYVREDAAMPNRERRHDRNSSGCHWRYVLDTRSNGQNSDNLLVVVDLLQWRFMNLDEVGSL